MLICQTAKWKSTGVLKSHRNSCGCCFTQFNIEKPLRVILPNCKLLCGFTVVAWIEIGQFQNCLLARNSLPRKVLKLLTSGVRSRESPQAVKTRCHWHHAAP